MRLVIDTNLWISGLLWRGLPRQLLRLAESHQVELCVTPPMLAELSRVFAYPKFESRLTQSGLSVPDLMAYVFGLVSVFEAPTEPAIVVADPTDDIFLHCAAIAQAAYVISGDQHLLDLGSYQNIPILTVRDFFAKEFPDELQSV